MKKSKYEPMPSPYRALLDLKKKKIIITYTKHILEEPGIIENIKLAGELYAPYIEASLKEKA